MPHLRLRLIAGLFALYQRIGYFAKARDWSDRLASELPADGRISTEVLSPRNQLTIVYVWLELDRRGPSEVLARGLIETCRARAVQSALSAECLSDVSAAEVGLGDVLLRADQPAQALALYEKSLATYERIVAEFGETAERLRDTAVSQFNLGNLAHWTGNLVIARERFAASESLFARLAARLEASSAQLERDHVRARIAEVDRAVTTMAPPTAPTIDVESEIVCRNAPCPCGSGKKYKRCHGTLT